MATADMPPNVRHLAFFDSDSRPRPFWSCAAIYKHYLPRIGATTGYRWLIPQRSTAPNHIVSAINCNVMAVLGRDAHHWIWGGSWAIRRETFEQLGIRQAWEGMLSDDLVASNRLRGSGLEVRFDPACVLTSPVDFDWSGMFDFVRRQYCITRRLCLRLVVGGLVRGDAHEPGLDRLACLVGARHGCLEHGGMVAGGGACRALRPGALPRLGHAKPGCRLLARKSLGTPRRAAVADLGEPRSGLCAMAGTDRLGLGQPREVEGDRLSAAGGRKSSVQEDCRDNGTSHVEQYVFSNSGRQSPSYYTTPS